MVVMPSVNARSAIVIIEVMMGNCHRHHDRDQAGLRCPTQRASRPNTVQVIMIAKQSMQPAIDVAGLAPCADTLHALLVARADALMGRTEAP